jgi:hypothetical protein
MSGSLYGYTRWEPPRETPAQAGLAGFTSAQEIERRAMGMDEARQQARLREMAEQRTAQRFPVDLQTAEQALRTAQQAYGFAGQRNPLELERLRLQNQAAGMSAQQAAAAAAAFRGLGDLPAFGGQPTVAPPFAPGVTPPGTVPGLRAPEGVTAPAAPPAAAPPAAAPPAAAPPGPQSELRPPWLSPQFGQQERFPSVGPATASLGLSDATGAPPGVAPPEGAAEDQNPLTAFVNTLDRPRLIELRNRLRRAVGPFAMPSAQRDAILSAIETRLEALPTTPPAAPAATPAAPAAAPAAAAADDAEDFQRMLNRSAAAGVTPPGAQPTARQEEPLSGRYIVEPARIEADRRRLAAEYEQLQVQHRLAVASRNPAAIMQIRQRANEINEQARFLDGMRAITRFNQGDATQLAAAMYTESNGRIELQPQADGSFNIFLDGQLSRQNVSRRDIELSARTLFDQRYLQQVQQRQEMETTLALRAAQQRIDQTARATAEIAVEAAKAELALRYPTNEVRNITLPDGGQAVVVIGRNGAIVSGARVVRLPPLQAGGQERIVLQPMYANQ